MWGRGGGWAGEGAAGSVGRGLVVGEDLVVLVVGGGGRAGGGVAAVG